MPRRVVQADWVKVNLSVRPSGVVCQLALRYADGRLQPGLGAVRSTRARARWRFRIVRDAAPGRAQLVASCGSAGSVTRTLLVVGSVVPARIVVVKDGWSTRQQPYGGTVSYGVVLRNTSPSQDALQVYALVNFVGPDNRLVGSATTTVPGIPAGQQFALGGQLLFPGMVPPISRLEVVVQIQKRATNALKQPTITNVFFEPSILDAHWLGGVDGEISNDKTALILENTQLSTVVFDRGGNVIGGGSGFAFASLPPAAREFFKVQNGLDSIPFANAASAMVSAVGTYSTP
jgi:hypothetical protein